MDAPVGQRGHPLGSALAGRDVQELLVRLDVADLDGHGLGDAKACAIGGDEGGTVMEVGRRQDQALDLEEVGVLCALGQIGDAHLVDHPLAKRATHRPTGRLVSHHRSPSVMTAHRRTVPTTDRLRDRWYLLVITRRTAVPTPNGWSQRNTGRKYAPVKRTCGIVKVNEA